ncbi:hypothetical protein NP493_229g02045 [Ridgeia piscesae]|uniref:Uncharacterized protein n=1 Tax=Ridgeia piscesae TaxID=27915 RepID=A0AAD9P019_RIDPI|nr:hypothetical protein NP493_229g02045 [Ridgeia piscesae]
MYVQSQPQQDCRVDLVCMYVRDGDAATFLCCAHGRTLASDTIYIYNIIYTCFTCTKIITLHSVTVTLLSQRSVTRWRARAARDCLASSLARCVHLQQCITGNQSVCTNQFGTESTRKKQRCTVGCSRLFTQLSRRNRYTSSTILKQHSPHDFLHNCGGDTTTI